MALNWTANGEADLAGYRVYRATTAPVPTAGTPLNGATLLTSPSYTDTTALNGTTYHYVVVAVDGAGNASAASSDVAATPSLAAGTALQLNGTNQYVTFGAAPAWAPPTFTLETWFKRTGAGVGTTTGNGGIASAIPLITKGRAESRGLERRHELLPRHRRDAPAGSSPTSRRARRRTRPEPSDQRHHGRDQQRLASRRRDV